MAHRRGPDNSVRIAIEGTQGSLNWANIFWCQLSTSGSIAQADLNTWTTAFANAYKTDFAPQMSTTPAFKLAVATCFTPGNNVLQASSTMTGNGTGASTNVNDQSACAIVSWLTSVYWRGGKPRTYLPGLEQSATTGNTSLTSTYQSALQSAGAGFITGINALTATSITGTQLGFVSFFSGNALRGTPLFFAFTGAKVHPRIGSQRRRLGKWQV